MQDLTITLLQSDLYWHQADANRAMFEEKIWQLPNAGDVIVLPEMFTTGFTMEGEKWAEPMNLTTFQMDAANGCPNRGINTRQLHRE
jgi:omega-amidase